MKYLNRKETMATLFALIGFAVAIQNSLAQTQSTMQVSKQEFVDMSLNMAEKANIKQAKKKRQYESSLRETMSDEEFNKHQSETQKKALVAEEKLASCLGISHAKLKSFEQAMNTEFQVSAIEQCKSKLPEKISMTGLLDPTNKPELEPYVSCMEKLAVKKIGVSADKIKACAAAQE